MEHLTLNTCPYLTRYALIATLYEGSRRLSTSMNGICLFSVLPRHPPTPTVEIVEHLTVMWNTEVSLKRRSESRSYCRGK